VKPSVQSDSRVCLHGARCLDFCECGASRRVSPQRFVFASLFALRLIVQPPGSNNRCRERTDSTFNLHRLFDSQNNARGGYPWRGNGCNNYRPDPLTYYTGSHLRVEWTNGANFYPNGNVETILQYACEDTLPGLRDGYPSGWLVDGDVDNEGYCHATFQFNNFDNDITNSVSNGRTTCADTIPWKTVDNNGQTPQLVDANPANQRGGGSCTTFGSVMNGQGNPFTRVDDLWQPLANCDFYFPDADAAGLVDGVPTNFSHINSAGAGLEFGMHEGPLYCFVFFFFSLFSCVFPFSYLAL
jgi:hypothetical protein